MLTLDTIRDAPKALLHDHLDGGLRPATVIDLAAEFGYDGLPTTDVDELAAWFRRGADRKSLELYLETFAHTFGVMQERDAIIRVAAECAEDLAADGVVYAEVRMAPELSHRARPDPRRGRRGATSRASGSGAERAAEAGRPIVMKMLVTAMRQAARSVEVAECAVRWRDAGVVGFDIAGPGGGLSADPPPRRVRLHPPRELPHHDPRRRVVRAAVDLGGAPVRGAERLGHGVRIVDDITVRDDGSVELGRLAAFVRDRRVPLEMCPTSNVHTGAARLDRRAPDRPAPPPALPGHGQHRQPADERRLAVERVRGARRGVRDRPRRDGVADDQRDEERVRAVRRAAAAHQRGREARLRAPARRARPGSSPAG